VTTGIEVWAGIECSYNRVGDRYFDQLERSGLYERVDAIDHLASLGVTAVRFPLLWERVVALGERAWEWTDAALEALRGHGITPIVGLMHHGSGPPETGLADDALPERLAAFARTVAERYPWVEQYTPINEPLTTARFATLYGLWHPHATSPRTFARAMLLQCRAIRDAMRAVRGVNSDAQLVQTEDLGKTHATATLEYQARFENERRWLTFDLLAGRVVAQHAMATYMRWLGVRDRELEALADDPCPPDVIGVNHYLTSERFLDHRLQRYPRHAWGGNERHRYADVEAVRVLRDGVAGPYVLLREAWERYRRPVAVTEVQLACTREQQLRWFDEVWNAAARLHREGADVRAVTAWSAFGAHDWSSLLTRNDGHYEPGVFDMRAQAPRPTALATMVRSLAVCGFFEHPALHAPGWWRCDERLTYPPVKGSARVAAVLRRHRHEGGGGVRRRGGASPVLIVGARGTLGQAVVRACAVRGLAAVALSRAELDATDERAVTRVVSTVRPWCVVNCAGFVRVDDAECEQTACRVANVDGARVLARACASFGAKFVTFSTDLVFDGTKGSPYIESDSARPLCEYGRAKAMAEEAVTAVGDALIVRTAAFFGDHDEHNFVTRVLRALASGQEFRAVSDVVVSPTYVPDLVDAALDLAIDGESGVWHLASAGALTWEELARRAARAADVNSARLVSVTVEELGLAAARPRYSALTSERGSIMASVDDAIARYARSRPWERTSFPAGTSGSQDGRHRARSSNSFLSSTGARGRTWYEGMADAGDGS
jgi:dTDP-4-dehydrorhamnose reductase